MGWERVVEDEVEPTPPVTPVPTPTRPDWAPLGSIRGPAGEKGPPGPRGPAGADSPLLSVTFNFGMPSTVWTMPHDLGRRIVDIVAVDPNGIRVEGEPVYVSEVEARIEWYHPMIGSATVSL